MRVMCVLRIVGNPSDLSYLSDHFKIELLSEELSV